MYIFFEGINSWIVGTSSIWRIDPTENWRWNMHGHLPFIYLSIYLFIYLLSCLLFVFFLFFLCYFLGITSHNLLVIECDCLGNVHRVGIHLHAAAISAQGTLSFLLVLLPPSLQPPQKSTDEMWQRKAQVHFLEIYQHPEGKLQGKGTIEKAEL